MVRAKLSVRTFTAKRRPSRLAVLPGRTAALVRQRKQQYYCCLIYNLPIFRMLGASARWSRLHAPVETGTPPYHSIEDLGTNTFAGFAIEIVTYSATKVCYNFINFTFS